MMSSPEQRWDLFSPLLVFEMGWSDRSAAVEQTLGWTQTAVERAAEGPATDLLPSTIALWAYAKEIAADLIALGAKQFTTEELERVPAYVYYSAKMLIGILTQPENYLDSSAEPDELKSFQDTLASVLGHELENIPDLLSLATVAGQQVTNGAPTVDPSVAETVIVEAIQKISAAANKALRRAQQATRNVSVLLVATDAAAESLNVLITRLSGDAHTLLLSSTETLIGRLRSGRISPEHAKRETARAIANFAVEAATPTRTLTDELTKNAAQTGKASGDLRLAQNELKAVLEFTRSYLTETGAQLEALGFSSAQIEYELGNELDSCLADVSAAISAEALAEADLDTARKNIETLEAVRNNKATNWTIVSKPRRQFFVGDLPAEIDRYHIVASGRLRIETKKGFNPISRGKSLFRNGSRKYEGVIHVYGAPTNLRGFIKESLTTWGNLNLSRTNKEIIFEK